MSTSRDEKRTDTTPPAQPVSMIIAVVLKFATTSLLSALTYATIWLTTGSGWTRNEVAAGVSAAVMLGLIAGGIWHRMQNPHLEPSEADVHAPEQWSLTRTRRERDESKA